VGTGAGAEEIAIRLLGALAEAPAKLSRINPLLLTHMA
jgi:hypothetical protein